MRSPLTFTLLGGEIEKVGGPATQKSLLSPCPCTESIRADPLTFTLLGGEIEKVGGSATHKELTCGLWSLEYRYKAGNPSSHHLDWVEGAGSEFGYLKIWLSPAFGSGMLPVYQDNMQGLYISDFAQWAVIVPQNLEMDQ